MSDIKSANLLALKGRFRAPNMRYYGKFFFLINQKSSFIDVALVVITASADLYNNTTITESWKKFESDINKIKYENRYSQAITSEFQAIFKQIMVDKNFYAELMKAIYAPKIEPLNFILSNIFRRIIKDDEFSLESHVESAVLEEESPEASEAADSGSELSGTYLPIKLDLDPITGKNVRDVRPDEKIMVRIIPQGDRANLFIDQAGLRAENGFVKPAIFTVTSVTFPGKGVELVGKLAENVYGRILEEQNVLVRKYEPAKKTESGQVAAQPVKITSNEENKKLLVILGGLMGIGVLGSILYWVLARL